MDKKFTTGVWHLGHFSGSVFGEKERLVANTMGYATNMDNGEHIDENNANAALISASPELLEALEALMDACDALHPQHRPNPRLLINAERAIKKAYGE